MTTMCRTLTFTRPNGSLVPIEKVKDAIASMSDPTDVSDFARKLEAAKRACADTDERRDYFAELAVWALERLGELLKAMPKQNGARGRPGPGRGNKTARQLGAPFSQLIQRQTAVRSQKLAAAGKPVLAKYVAECKKKGKEITKAGALAAAKRHLREKSLKACEADSLPKGLTVTGKQDVVSCDALITDPPYGITGEPWEPDDLEAFTRNWLSRWDEANAEWFVSFFSQDRMWDMRRWMDDELRGYAFHHLCIWHYPNGMGHKTGHILKESWEPIFVYRRLDVAPERQEWDWGSINNLDCIREGAPRPGFEGEAEQRHPCQKPVRVMKLLVTAFCKRAGLVADPFCGSGSTGIAAHQLGRRFHGIESSPAYRKLATSRISLFGGTP